MYTHPDLFYDIEVEGHEYTSNPTSHLLVKRLANAQPDYWLRTQPVKAKEKKTLIFVNFVLQCHLSCPQIKAMLSKLLSDEFEILAWKDGSLAPLTKTNLDMFIQKNGYETKPIDKQNIEQAIKDKKLNLEHCFFLDQLLQSNIDERQYCIINIKKINPMTQKFLSCLKSFIETDICFIQDEFSDNAISTIKTNEYLLKEHGVIKHEYKKLGFLSSFNLLLKQKILFP